MKGRKRSKRDEVADAIGCCAVAYTLVLLPLLTGAVCLCRGLGIYGPCQGERLLVFAVLMGLALWWTAIIIKPSSGK